MCYTVPEKELRTRGFITKVTKFIWLVVFWAAASSTGFSAPGPEEWPARVREAVEIAHHSGFYLTVLHREHHGRSQYVVILGEYHSQGKGNARKGRQIVSLFAQDAVGYEDDKFSNYWSTYLFSPLIPDARSEYPHSTVLEVRDMKGQLAHKVWLESGHVSDVWEELNYGGPTAMAVLLTGSLTVLAAERACSAAVVQMSPRAQRNTMIVKKVGFVQMGLGAALIASGLISITVEFSSDIPADSSQGLTGNRNVTMSRNVAEEIGREDGVDVMLAVVGMGHNDGIAYHLGKAGFATIYSRIGDDVPSFFRIGKK